MAKCWWNDDDVVDNEDDLTGAVFLVTDKKDIENMVSKAVAQGSIYKGENSVCLSAKYGCTTVDVFKSGAVYAGESGQTALIQVGQCGTIAAVKPGEMASVALERWRGLQNGKLN